MAITKMSGFEVRGVAAGKSPEGETLNGTSSYSTTTVRTGSASLRCNPASGASGHATFLVNSGFNHFAIRFATLPSVARYLSGSNLANTIGLRINTDGTLSVMSGSTVVGTSTVALVTDNWYWIGYCDVASATGVLLQIDGLDQVSGTNGTVVGGGLGAPGTEASSVDLFIDDFILDNAGFLAPSRVGVLRPISDNSRTNWTAGAGGTTNLWNAVDNSPVSGVASASETDTTNIESGSNTGTANYIANMQSYVTAGLRPTDVILGIFAIINHGEDIATGTKTGSFEVTANPVIAATTFTFGGDAGAHGNEVGFWGGARSSLSTSAVTLDTSPTMKVTKTDTTTRTGCIDAMAMQIAYMSGPLAHLLQTMQAINRSARF